MPDRTLPSQTSATVIKAHEGRHYQVGEEKMIFRLTGKETNGQYSLIERLVAPYFKSPPEFHAHTDTDWSCHIIDGDLKFHFSDHSPILTAGDTVYVPRNTFFRWENPSSNPARILITYTPAGFEDFFAELADFLNSTTRRIDNYQETLEFILKTQDKYKMYRKA